MDKAMDVVQYQYYTTKNFNYYKFSSYKDRTGKIIKYTDINGNVDELIFRNPSVVLSKNNEGHMLIDKFLKNSPEVLRGEWKRTDLQAKQKQETKATLDSARAIIEAAKMSDKDIKDFATLKGMN